jgi:hypothetical protein
VTFQRQVRLSRIVGLGLLMAGLILTLSVTLMGIDRSNPPSWTRFVFDLVIGCGVFIVGIGGVIRPWQRHMWFGMMKESTLEFRGRRYADHLLDGPLSGLWRIFIHIDRNGNDLDARTR